MLPTDSKKGGDSVTEQLAQCVTALRQDASVAANEVKAIAIGIPGQIDAKQGIVRNAPNISNWKDYPLTAKLSKLVGPIPIYLENDAHCAAMGELYYGAGKRYSNLVFMTVSTGVGGGVIINRKLWPGFHGIAGEVGHMALNLPGDGEVECGCGRKGCLEAYASGVSMAKRATKKLKEASVLRDNYGRKVLELSERNGGKITSIILSEAAQAGDEFAIDMIKENAYYIGIACANLMTIIDPDAIVIGGGVSKIGDLLFNEIRNTAYSHVSMLRGIDTPIESATTGTDAGLFGALAVGLSQ
jgi:glucokinase